MSTITNPRPLPHIPTLFRQLVERCGKPQTWIGRCAALAQEAVDLGVPGRSVHGHWLGPMGSSAAFRDRTIFTQHEWVKLPDGRVLDPTRWVFLDEWPRIYVGPPDFYDEGGNRVRQAFMGEMPEWSPDEPQHYYDGDSHSWQFIERLLELDQLYDREDYRPGKLTRAQLFWLANQPLEVLGAFAREIYAWIEREDQLEAIPIDNLRRYEAEFK